jgi:hypothetical protein
MYEQAPIKGYVPNTLNAHPQMYPNLFFDDLTVRRILGQKLGDELIKALHMVRIMQMVELLSKQLFLHELVVMFFEVFV